VNSPIFLPVLRQRQPDNVVDIIMMIADIEDADAGRGEFQ
jgi:hypothetical protein